MPSDDLLDFSTVLAVNEEVLADPDRPVIKQLNPLDPVEVEVTLLEADHLVEQYFEKYRSRFINAEFFDVLREAYRRKYREHITSLVEWARSLVKGLDMDTEYKRTMEQQLADDGLEVVQESPLEIRHINGAIITGEAAKEIVARYKRKLRYGKQ